MPLVRLYYHLVWATRLREGFITPEIEPPLYRYMIQKCGEHASHCYAINGMPDHVHLIASISENVAVAEFVKDLKGSSSRMVSAEFGTEFEWQGDYGAFTVSERNLQQAIAYVEQQKLHHANRKLIRRYEPDEIKRQVRPKKLAGDNGGDSTE